MNKAIAYIILILAFGCQHQEKKTEFEWTLEKERIHNENRNDSTKWSLENWEIDAQNITLEGTPIIKGIFPIPKYELTDSTFNGVGSSGNWNGIELKDRKIIHHSLYVNRNAVNKEFINEKPNEVYFTIAVLTDTTHSDYSHTNVNVISRNNPHQIGQGYIKTKSNKVDFIAFLTADRNNYAIVNMRMFDLRIGRIILIAPQKDGTLRSLQRSSSIMSSQEMDDYIENLISNDKEVIEFFTMSGNI